MTGQEALYTLLDFLNTEELSYMVVGSFSSNYHGIPRSTKDADIVVEFDASRWAEMMKSLPDGLTADLQPSFEMVTATTKDVLQVEGSLFEIELFHLSDDAFDQERFKRRERVNLGDKSLAWIATAEDVIVQKLRWMKNAERAKDFEDVVSVLLQQGEALDFAYIRRWCAEHDSTEWLEKALAKVAEIDL